ncbi:MAG: hypothetical protein MUF46_06100, partial [Desulfobacterales bacterium]|nr:hypothetical protein [Desulfobacterales bacterium]
MESTSGTGMMVTHEESERHDVEERIDGNVGVAALLEVVSRHLFGDVVHVGGHPDVGAGNPLGEAGGAAGVEDVGEIDGGVDRGRGRNGGVAEQGPE